MACPQTRSYEWKLKLGNRRRQYSVTLIGRGQHLLLCIVPRDRWPVCSLPNHSTDGATPPIATEACVNGGKRDPSPRTKSVSSNAAQQERRGRLEPRQVKVIIELSREGLRRPARSFPARWRSVGRSRSRVCRPRARKSSCGCEKRRLVCLEMLGPARSFTRTAGTADGTAPGPLPQRPR